MTYSEASLTALIGDLRGSRDFAAEDRAQTQLLITEILEDLTGRLEPMLATRLVLTAGDEVQGLFRNADAVVLAIQELTDRLQGSGADLLQTRKKGERIDLSGLPRHQIAFGIGYGTLSTGDLAASTNLHPNPSLLDGPAFHMARSAIQRSKKRNGWVSLEGFEPIAQEALEALFALMESIRRDWTSAQGLYTYQRRRVQYQKDLAQRWGVSGSVISESLSAAHFAAILKGEDAARALFREATKAGELT